MTSLSTVLGLTGLPLRLLLLGGRPGAVERCSAAPPGLLGLLWLLLLMLLGNLAMAAPPRPVLLVALDMS